VAVAAQPCSFQFNLIQFNSEASNEQGSGGIIMGQVSPAEGTCVVTGGENFRIWTGAQQQ
jgi:hypothetical protein